MTWKRSVASKLLGAIPGRFRQGFLDCVLSMQPEPNKLRSGILTMWGSIENLARNGFEPRTVVDVGAFVGEWSENAYRVFPSARFLMVEANPEKASRLEQVASRLGSAVSYRSILLGSAPREAVDFFQMETGSSVLEEATGFARTRLTLPMRTLDQIAGEAGLVGPFFLKLDVQGFELEVLRGAPKTIADTEVMLLEVSLLEYNRGAPLFAEVVAFMVSRGFVAYDVCGRLRRESDATLVQVDVIFVRETSRLRAKKKFYTNEPDTRAQRAASL